MAKTVGRATYEEQTGAKDAAWKAVYPVAIYNTNDAIDHLQYAVDTESFFSEIGKIINYVEGLQILKVDVNRNARLTSHPIENGQRVVDNKVIEPTKITITAMCDNKRGEAIYGGMSGKDFGKSRTPTSIKESITMGANDLLDKVVNGRNFETEQSILTFAQRVYARLERMLAEKEEFVTYTISTKGAVYMNMMLTGIDQLNDPEHLLTIPVTLRFEECIIPGKQSVIVDNEDDADITMGGSMHEKSVATAIKDNIVSAFTFGE